MASRDTRDLALKVAEYRCRECDKQWKVYMTNGDEMACPNCDARTKHSVLRWPNEGVRAYTCVDKSL